MADLTLPLNPLVSEEYCDVLLHHLLGDNLTLTPEARNIVRILWKRCLGIPRAIQILHRCLSNQLPVITKPKITDTDKKGILDEFYKQAKGYFATRISMKSYETYGMTQNAWEIFLVQNSLCMPSDPTTSLGNSTYAKLEADGAIFPFEFLEEQLNENARRRYTMPFHFFGESLTISFLAPEVPDSGLYIDHTPTVCDIVGTDGSEVSLKVQGESLERACAVSLWARFKLAKKTDLGYVKLNTIVTSWKNPDHYVRLSGVVKACNQIVSDNFDENLPAIIKARAIVMNAPNSKFADVLVPIFVLKQTQLNQLQKLVQDVQTATAAVAKQTALKKLLDVEEQCTHLLLIQCRNMQAKNSKITPAYVAKEWKKHAILPRMEEGHIYVLMAPNLNPKKPLSKRTASQQIKQVFKKNKGKWMETTGKNWLSDLFLATYQATEEDEAGIEIVEDSWSEASQESVEKKSAEEASTAKKGQQASKPKQTLKDISVEPKNKTVGKKRANTQSEVEPAAKRAKVVGKPKKK